jgi:hypothetical protein
LFAGFKGRVILLADCCYSGGLADVAQKLHAQGIRALALTSAEASSESTGNWTYTQTLIDDLSGRAIADRDGNGSVTLAEMSHEVADAMRNREHQRWGYADYGVPEKLVLSARKAGKVTGPGVRGWLIAANAGEPAAARVLAVKGDKLQVSFYDYATETVVWVDKQDTKAMSFPTFPVGAVVDVTWEHKAYEATILKVEDGFHYITYAGYGPEWNEWVMADRIVGLHK